MYILTGPGCGALLTDNLVNYTTKVESSYNDSFDESHISSSFSKRFRSKLFTRVLLS